MPYYFPENNTPSVGDPPWRSLQKIVDLTGGGGGGSGAYGSGGNYYGVGNPNGVVAASRGAIYQEYTAGGVFVKQWQKTTDTVNSGWV